MIHHFANIKDTLWLCKLLDFHIHSREKNPEIYCQKQTFFFKLQTTFLLFLISKRGTIQKINKILMSKYHCLITKNWINRELLENNNFQKRINNFKKLILLFFSKLLGNFRNSLWWISLLFLDILTFIIESESKNNNNSNRNL